MEPKTGKRIVSKGDYAANVGKKTAASSFSLLLLILGLCCIGVAVVCGLGMIFEPQTWLLLPIVGCGSAGAFLLNLGSRAAGKSKQIDLGVPLTRANTADLPAPDSLVRASSEPIQEQEAVLLRAAAQGVDTPPEQLVRAVNGQE